MARETSPFPNFNKKLLVTCVLAGLASNYASAQQSADDPEVEEVVVTGSFIRGTPLDAPSPVQIVDRESIEAQGAAVVWDVIKNLEVNSGSFADNGSEEVYGTAGTAQVNLRNLGENSTLTLVNGKRMVPSGATTRAGGEFVDINAIPLVMTDRIEILTDGGSALYGADAVAGVVNVIMRDDFEGLELYGDLQGVVEADGQYDAIVSGIWGWASDSGATHFVLSAERMEKDPVNVTAAPFYNESTQLLTGGASAPGTTYAASWLGAQVNPDWILQDLRDINQQERDIYRPGTNASFAWGDPLCDGSITDASGNPFFIVGYDPRQRAQLGSRSDSCVVDESQWRLISYEQERNSVAGSFDHTFDDGTEFYSFVMWSDQETIRAGSGYRGSFGSYSFLPSAGAYAPYRHGQAMELGHFAPLFGKEKPLNITNNPADGINGGPNTGYSHSGVYNVLRTGGNDDTTYTDTGNLQIGLRGDFEAFNRNLDYDVSYSVGYSSVETKRRDFNRYNLHMAGVGLGGPNCVPDGRPDFDFLSYNDPTNPLYARNAWNIFANTSIFDYVFEGYYVQPHEPLSYGLTSTNQGKDGCMFFNPFLSALTNPNVANSPELMEWLTDITAMKDKRNTQGVFDAVVSGEMFEMRGGMSAFAMGYQHRERTANSHASDLNLPGLANAIQGYDHTQFLPGTNITGVPNKFGYVSNNMGGASNSLEYDLARDVDAVYFELSLPFWENVESQVALRYEDYGGAIGSEVSPKVALSWRPVDTLLMRGSWSESFRAPNLGIIGAGLDASSVTFLDPLDNQRVRAGLLPATNEYATLESTYTLGFPAPDVGNEYADTFSAGFIWTPDGALDGVSVQADFWRFEVSDRVLPENATSAIKRQVEAFNEAAFNPDGSYKVNNYVLNSSLDAGQAGDQLFAPCNPAQLEAQFGRDSDERLDCVVDQRLYQVPGVDESIPNPDRALIQLALGAINAGEITADGVDVKLGYRWANDWGRFNLSTDYTFVNQYELNNVPGLENGLLDVGVFNAAGTTGDGNLVRSLPDHKGNVTFSWFSGDQGVTVINRFIGSYTDLTYDLRINEVNPFVASLMEREIDDYWRTDVQYNYTHNWANSNLGQTRFTAGVIDIFKSDIPVRETGSLDYDAQVFDGRGQRFYLRALWMF